MAGALIAFVTIVLFICVAYALIKLGEAKQKNEDADKAFRQMTEAKRAKDNAIIGSDNFNRVRDKYSRK